MVIPTIYLTSIAIIANGVLGHSPFKNNAVKPLTPLSKTINPITPATLEIPSTSAFGTSLNQNRNPFEIIYQWKILDFQYPSSAHRARAIASGDFVPVNNLPLGVDSAGDRLFVTLPRWKNGVPASLIWLPLPQVYTNPPLMPYPDWSFHGNPDAPDCSKLMSVYRLWIDECERLWVLDAGVVNATIKINNVCPPKIVVFDLRTDRPLFLYELPPDQIKEDSLHSNMIVDVRNGKCDDGYAYITGVLRFGVVVFNLAQGRSLRTTNHLYLPNPLASDFTLHGLNFQWTDGVFGLSLTPINEYNDRLMFFHPMSSTNEFMVSTSVLRNESIWLNGGLANAFVPIGDRGARGQSSTSGIDRNNVQFYNLVHQDAVGCWDTTKPYTANYLDIVAKDNETLFFPNDMKLDREIDQGLWVLSNRLPVYLYSKLDYNDVNFRIQRVGVRDAVAGTKCEGKK